MKTGAQIVLGIVAGITIVATADNIRKILKDQADLKKQLKSLEKESLYKQIEATFAKQKRGIDHSPDKKRNELILKGFELAEETVDEAFGHPSVRWRRLNPKDFYSEELLNNVAKGTMPIIYPREEQK